MWGPVFICEAQSAGKALRSSEFIVTLRQQKGSKQKDPEKITCKWQGCMGIPKEGPQNNNEDTRV